MGGVAGPPVGNSLLAVRPVLQLRNQRPTRVIV